MGRSLLRYATLYTRSLVHSAAAVNSKIPIPPLVPLTASSRPGLRFYSSESNTPGEKPNPVPESSALEEFRKKGDSIEGDDTIEAKNNLSHVKDVSNKELKGLLENYFKGNEETLLPSIMEAIVRRKITGKHEETHDELIEELRMKPRYDVADNEFVSDFEDLHETDNELDDLYNTKEYVLNKRQQDKFIDMDNKKWDEMIKEATEKGFLKDTKECREILEDMVHFDKLLPDDIKEKVKKKFNELGDMCERGELEPEEAYKLFKQFEDEIVVECRKREAFEGPCQLEKTTGPPGKGPILRWQTRAVLSPDGEQWHPKNRLVKMSVTVKELGLSKHEFQRLRELVGKRYHPGKDELTITSERFDYREENKKDCLRTLYALLDEARKANKLAEDARVSYVKHRLRANPAFMDRLRVKIMRQTSNAVSA